MNVGNVFLELYNAGHILFQDWELTAYCHYKSLENDLKIWVNFGIADVEVKGYSPLLEELEGLCDCMRICLSEWLTYIEKKRDTYYNLNHFTAKQLVFLCCSLAEFRKQNISARLLNMLSVLKENIEENDLQNALTQALETPDETCESQESFEFRKFLHDYPDVINYFLATGFTEEVIKAAIMFCEENSEGDYKEQLANIEEYREAVMDCIDEHESDEEWADEWCNKYESTKDNVLKNQMKFKGVYETQETSFSMTKDQIHEAFKNLKESKDKIAALWDIYHRKLSGLVSDKFVDLDVLGETMNHLTKSATQTVQRNLQFILEEGKPNLISCNAAEMIPLCLSLYKDVEQPLPTFDEILICAPETTVEEVELLIRRAMQPGSTHNKIYCLLNAERLNHDVARKFESIFIKKTEDMSVHGGSCKSDYRLIIFCDSEAHHSYVATAFDMNKRNVTQDPRRNEEIKEYLHAKNHVPAHDFLKSSCHEQFTLRTKLIFSEHASMGKNTRLKSHDSQAPAPKSCFFKAF